MAPVVLEKQAAAQAAACKACETDSRGITWRSFTGLLARTAVAGAIHTWCDFQALPQRAVAGGAASHAAIFCRESSWSRSRAFLATVAVAGVW